MKEKVDWLIIGGGLAGLYAASRLYSENESFLLAEASDHLGGRIKGINHACDSEYSVDLGPTWFWPHQANLQRLASDLNLNVFTQFVEGDVLYEMPNQPISRHQGTPGLTSYRFVGGTEKLLQKLREGIPNDQIEMDAPVKDMRFTNSTWQVVFANGSAVQAQNIIIAVPPRVITKTMETDNWLTLRGKALLEKTPGWMSAQAKFIATYKVPHWRNNGLSGDAFSRVGPMVEIHDASNDDGGFALFGFIGVPAIHRIRLSTEQLEQACLAQLRRFFGDSDPESIFLQDWNKEEFVATALDQTDTPNHPYSPLPQLYNEIKGKNIYFAATEFASNEAGYMEGALVAVNEALKLGLHNRKPSVQTLF